MQVTKREPSGTKCSQARRLRRKDRELAIHPDLAYQSPCSAPSDHQRHCLAAYYGMYRHANCRKYANGPFTGKSPIDFLDPKSSGIEDGYEG